VLPKYVGPADHEMAHGTIVFYRPALTFGHGQRHDILVDGVRIGWSSPGTRLEIRAAPGLRVVTCPNSAYAGQRAVEVTVRAGETT